MTTTSLEGVDQRPGGDAQVSGTWQRMRDALAELRRRVRFGVTTQGIALFTKAFLGYYVLTLAVDRFFRLEQGVRAVLLFGWLAWLVVSLARTWLRPLAFPLDDEELALAVERSRPGLGSHLISALQFCRRLDQRDYAGGSPGLMAKVVEQIADALPKIEFSSAVRRDRIRKAMGMAFACIAIVVGCAMYSPPSFGIWAQRNLLLDGTVEWPRMTHLSVVGEQNGRLTVPRGDDFTVEVDVEGVMPEQIRLEYTFPDRTNAVEAMVQNTGEQRFSYTFPGLMDPVEFYAWGGDGETKMIKVALVDRPALEQATIRAHFPRYMGREPETVDREATEVLVPMGCEIEYNGVATKQLESASLALEDQTAPVELAGDRRSFRGKLQPNKSGLLFVKMTDVDGLSQGEGDRLLVKVVPDRAPRLTVRVRGLGQKITSKARIPSELTVVDDFGLTDVRMQWAVGDSAAVGQDGTFRPGDADGLEEFDPSRHRTMFQRKIAFDLQPLLKKPEAPMSAENPVRPGHFLAVRYSAKDNYKGVGAENGRESQSDSYTFKVVTEAELLADLYRRQEELSRQFEKLIQDQTNDRDEFVDLRALSTPGELGAKVRRRVAFLSRHQRTLARQVLNIGRRYAEILEEMLNNRVADEGDLRSLQTRIVDKLQALGESAMLSLAKLIEQYREAQDEGLKPEVHKLYDQTLQTMRRILADMRRLQSFTQVLRQLKRVIEIEGKAHQEAKQAYQKALDALRRR